MNASLTASSVAASSTTAPGARVQFRQRCFWLWIGAASFHVAYEFPVASPLIALFLYSVFRLAHYVSRPGAMYLGWILGLLIYGPQLAFFWTIFGAGAIALWLVLACWLSFYLVLQRFALMKFGLKWGALLAPFLWTGLEYFRSELYYLRFSWLNIGYVFAPFPENALMGWLGMYGVGFVLMFFAANLPHWKIRTRIAALGVAGMAILIIPQRNDPARGSTRLHLAGAQLEFQSEASVLQSLERLYQRFPDAPLLVLSEYTFDGPVPEQVKQWCAERGRYLIAGGKDYVDATETEFRNTAFVIGPDGREVFKQVKAVPIQFFKDGLPATEQAVWNSPWGRLGLSVCYDLSYTRVTDELIRHGAQAIIVPTMDVEEWGERQHRLHGRVAPIRAAEYRVPIFRLCSSGISQAVERSGRVQSSAPFPGPGELIAADLWLEPPQFHLPLDRTLAWVCVAATMYVGIWHITDSWRNRRLRARSGNVLD